MRGYRGYGGVTEPVSAPGNGQRPRGVGVGEAGRAQPRRCPPSPGPEVTSLPPLAPPRRSSGAVPVPLPRGRPIRGGPPPARPRLRCHPLSSPPPPPPPPPGTAAGPGTAPRSSSLLLLRPLLTFRGGKAPWARGEGGGGSGEVVPGGERPRRGAEGTRGRRGAGCFGTRAARAGRGAAPAARRGGAENHAAPPPRSGGRAGPGGGQRGLPPLSGRAHRSSPRPRRPIARSLVARPAAARPIGAEREGGRSGDNAARDTGGAGTRAERCGREKGGRKGRGAIARARRSPR